MFRIHNWADCKHNSRFGWLFRIIRIFCCFLGNWKCLFSKEADCIYFNCFEIWRNSECYWTIDFWFSCCQRLLFPLFLQEQWFYYFLHHSMKVWHFSCLQLEQLLRLHLAKSSLIFHHWSWLLYLQMSWWTSYRSVLCWKELDPLKWQRHLYLFLHRK